MSFANLQRNGEAQDSGRLSVRSEFRLPNIDLGCQWLLDPANPVKSIVLGSSDADHPFFRMR